LDGDAGAAAAAAAAERNREPIGLRFRAEERGLELVTLLGSFGASLLLASMAAVKEGQQPCSSLSAGRGATAVTDNKSRRKLTNGESNKDCTSM
jgi:hypothetical protein